MEVLLVGVGLLESSGFKVVSEISELESDGPIVRLVLGTSGCKVVCVIVGLTTEVMIVVLKLEATGFKVVSDWDVGLFVVTIVEGFKVVSDSDVGLFVVTMVEGFKVVSDSEVGLPVVTIVEGFKVVSATVTGVPVTGVSDVAMSVSWLLLLVVDPNFEVVSLTILKLVVVVDSEDISGSEMDEVIVSEVETLIEL